MAVNLSPVGGVAAQFFTNTGAVLTGGKIYTYLAGTTTPAVTYTSSQGSTAQPNPIVLNAAGRVPGSGEIWLTDGILYKFVLEDANNVLIATYDNISGINSNFVAFVNQQQIVTATAGQTVFNLGISYQPGTNSLSVFVDGVNQYGPGAQYAYTETDADTVTFTSGLHVGAQVKFTTTQQQGGAAVDAQQVSYQPPFTGSVATNVEAKLAQTVSVIDFGAVGNGVVNDRAAIQAAFDSGAKQVYFPAGTYYLGSTATAIKFIDLSALGENISIFTEGFVEFVVETTAAVVPSIFYLKNNSHFTCGPVRFTDTGYDPLSVSPLKGASAITLDNASGGNWGNVVIDAIYGNNLVACVSVIGAVESANRIRGIHIKQLFSDDCFYGFNAQDQGDSVKIDNLIAFQNYRPYFVYGVASHQVKIFNRNNRMTSGAVNISRSVGGIKTTNIWVDYTARDMSVNITHVLVNHIDLIAGIISDIHLNLDINSSTAYTPLRFVNYTGSGGSETNAASTNIVRDVFISGSCDLNANSISVFASYLNKLQRITFNQGYALLCDSTVYAAFQFDQLARNQTPVWTATITNPSIGNGSITFDVDIVGGMCFYSLNLVIGSTTTLGSGEWLFSVPFTPTTSAIGSVYVLNSGVAYVTAVCKVSPSGTVIGCYADGSATGFNSTSPIAWNAGDELRLSIAYPIS
jgi:hypothetical protein